MSLKTPLLTVLLLCMVLSAQAQGRGPTTRVVRPCCTAVSSADVSADVIGVPSQQRARGSCVKALVFLTAKGFVCVNPEAAWAQRLNKQRHLAVGNKTKSTFRFLKG